MTGLDAHNNDFAKTTAYLASFVQHGEGRGRKISAFHAQGSCGGRHGGQFGRGSRSRGSCNGRGGLSGRGDGSGRGAKTDISARPYTDQEWALLRYNDKGKLFALRNKVELRKVDAAEISRIMVPEIGTIILGKG